MSLSVYIEINIVVDYYYNQLYKIYIKKMYVNNIVKL